MTGETNLEKLLRDMNPELNDGSMWLRVCLPVHHCSCIPFGMTL